MYAEAGPDRSKSFSPEGISGHASRTVNRKKSLPFPPDNKAENIKEGG